MKENDNYKYYSLGNSQWILILARQNIITDSDNIWYIMTLF